MKTATHPFRIPVVIFACGVVIAAFSFSGRVGNVPFSYGGGWDNLSSGPDEKGLRAVAVDPLNPQRVYIGSSKGVFISGDGGKNWVNCLDLAASKRAIPPDLSAGEKALLEGLQGGKAPGEISGVTALAVDPANPQKIVAGAVDGIYMCVDGGKTWAMADGSLRARAVCPVGLAIDPTNPDTIYAGTLGNALLKSADGGKSWQQMSVAEGERTVTAVAVHPFDSKVVYAATPDAVFKSKTGAASWDKVFSKGKAVWSVSIDQVNPEVVYLGTSAGVYKSSDGGSGWTEIGVDSLGQRKVVKVAVSPADSNAVYAATPEGVFGSADGGARWQDLSKGTGLKDAEALAFDPINSKVIWAATAGGLFRTAALQASPSAATAEAAPPAPAEMPAVQEAKEAPSPAAQAAQAEEMTPEQTAPATEPAAEKTVEVVDVGAAPAQAAAKAAEAAPAGPPIPTIDDVQTVLGQFSNEPTVQEVQEVAMRFAEVHPDLIEGWRKGAKYRALLPKFKLSFDFDRNRKNAETREFERMLTEDDRTTNQLKDKTEWTTTTGFDITEEVITKIEDRNIRRTLTSIKEGDESIRKQDWGFEFTWDLGDFLYNPDQVRISDEARDLVELRNDVLEEVTQFYFQRRQLQIDLLLSPAEELRERLRLELQLQEVTANIDYLTGGYLTQRMNDAKQGKVRKSNVLKRMFAI